MFKFSISLEYILTDKYTPSSESPVVIHNLLQRVILNSSAENFNSNELKILARFIPKDNSVVKTRGQRSIYIIRNSLRREIPNMDTFVSLGFDLDNVTVLSDSDMLMIPLGVPFPDVNSNDPNKK